MGVGRDRGGVVEFLDFLREKVIGGEEVGCGDQSGARGGVVVLFGLAPVWGH